jgi:hypothetical protein
MTFNARIHSRISVAWDLQDRGVSLKVFESFDGGGSCGYIVEFAKKEDLDCFVMEFGLPEPRTWIEHSDGRIEYLPRSQSPPHHTSESGSEPSLDPNPNTTNS